MSPSISRARTPLPSAQNDDVLVPSGRSTHVAASPAIVFWLAVVGPVRAGANRRSRFATSPKTRSGVTPVLLTGCGSVPSLHVPIDSEQVRLLVGSTMQRVSPTV